ncbi:MAG: hypothetical protein CVU78_05965 [Elusimicrobia bacterium HGW-Elusimicrobia-2]|nr:MAG: hypothetical protein CVU78_05965 [Elusimicrobia bacterium HGW-Elusimicrobia-2]
MKRSKNKSAHRSQEKGRPGDQKSVGNARILAAGLVILIGAFFLLRSANPAGNNFAAHASPFVFIFSWAVILAGILWDDGAEKE